MVRLSYWIDTFTKWTGVAAALLLFALIGLVVYDAGARYLFSAGSIGLQELEWHLFDAVFLLGIAYALKHGKHVRVDLFYAKYSPRVKGYVNLLGIWLFILPFSAFVAASGWEFAVGAYEMGEGSPNPGGLPHRYLIKGMIAVAFGLVILQALSEIVKTLRRIRYREDEETL